MTSKQLISEIEKQVASIDDFESEDMAATTHVQCSADIDRYYTVKRVIQSMCLVGRSAFDHFSNFFAWQERMTSLPKLTAVYYGRYPHLRKPGALAATKVESTSPEPEPSQDDAARSCPTCGSPNQDGDACPSCRVNIRREEVANA